MDSKPRIAVMGAGYWGRNHVRVFHQLGALRAVVDGSPEVRQRVAIEYPSVSTYPDLESLAEGGTPIDGVVVATPASTHLSAALECIDRGWHILVEKPAAPDLASVLRLADAAKLAGRVLGVGHLLLHHPYLRLAKQLIEQGRIGKPLYISAQRVNLGRVRTDEDVISSLAPHDLSMAHFLFGAEAARAAVWPITVIAKSQPLCDVAFVNVSYTNGLQAHYHFSWLDPFKRREFVVVGDAGMLVFDDMSKEHRLRIHDKGVEPRQAQDFNAFQAAIEVRDLGIEAPVIEMTEPLLSQAQDFIDCIQSGSTPIAGAASALAVARAMELIRAGMPE